MAGVLKDSKISYKTDVKSTLQDFFVGGGGETSKNKSYSFFGGETGTGKRSNRTPPSFGNHTQT